MSHHVSANATSTSPQFSVDLYDGEEAASQTSVDDFLLQKENRLDHVTKYRALWSRNTIRLSLIVHSAAIVLLCLVWLALAWSYSGGYAYGVNLIESPARPAVEYERKIIDSNLYVKNEYLGEPRPEMDAAWDGLLRDTFVAVSPSELLPESSVKLNDVTERVLVTLEVFNTMNCLNNVRKFAFRSYYKNSSILLENYDTQVERFGKCIEKIRQAIMCYSDISFSTYVWVKGFLNPFPNFRIAHECKNWNRIQQWAEDHRTPDLGDELLMHPIFGI
ncbi:tat pathway signal sequence [Metarhizium brunneum]